MHVYYVIFQYNYCLICFLKTSFQFWSIIDDDYEISVNVTRVNRYLKVKNINPFMFHS